MKRTPAEVMPIVAPLIAAFRRSENGTVEIQADTLRQAARLLLDMIDVEVAGSILSALVTVPVGTAQARCASCGRAGFWVITGGGQRLLVDCAPTGCTVPTADRPGAGIAHFATCVDAKQWRQIAAKKTLDHAETQVGVPSFGERDRGKHDRG